MSNSNIDTLKQIIADQKSAITDLGGTVITTNINPSPADITRGIRSIPVSDFSNATATEADVISGKTFYAGNKVLKTGTRELAVDDELFSCLFLESREPTEELYYAFPNNLTTIRNYMFCNNQKHATIHLPESTTTISAFAFKGCPNFIFDNLSDLEHLTHIRDNAFQECNNLDLANLPQSLTFIGPYAFSNSLNDNQSVIIPASVTSVNAYAFSCSSRSRKVMSYYDETRPTSIYLGYYALEYAVFNCDYHPNPNVSQIPMYYNNYGSFNNIYISSNITNVGQYAFNSGTNTTEEYRYRLNDVIFASGTPPTIGSNAFQRVKADTVKIYVPDGSEDDYKAVANLAIWRNNIYPISQRP